MSCRETGAIARGVARLKLPKVPIVSISEEEGRLVVRVLGLPVWKSKATKVPKDEQCGR